MKITAFQSPHLNIDLLETGPDRSVCFSGKNRSGILDLFSLISGQELPYQAQHLDLPDNPGVVSFKLQQEIYESELRKEETDFIGRMDPGTPARDFLTDPEKHIEMIRAFDMHHCLETGYRELSTGQSRKLLLLSSITKGFQELVLLSPFDGLDTRSRGELDAALDFLHRHGVRLFLFVHNSADIPSWCPEAVLIDAGKIKYTGTADRVREKMAALLKNRSADFKGQVSDFKKRISGRESKSQNDVLIEMKQGSAGYGGVLVFSNLSFKIREGDHTLVTGPNGCGKSTLLHVITGDHPACYQNDLHVFEIRRGTGESIWDIKKQMGIVSAELHRNYRVPGSAAACVLSGLFDSIGVYQPVSKQQERLAQTWLNRTGLEEKAQEPFRNLSYADQRLCLIARALIKSPRLLVLDEPTQGLDQANRIAVLDFLEELAASQYCTILYVSHREDEFRPFFRRQIRMEEFSRK